MRIRQILVLQSIILMIGCGSINNIQSVNLSSGTSFNSKDGYIMKIKPHDKIGLKVVVETEYVAEMTTLQKVTTYLEPYVLKNLLKDSSRINVDTLKNHLVFKLRTPEDGKTYWLVYFDPKIDPLPLNKIMQGGSIAIGCCCGEGDGCYVSADAQCLTKVCNACTNTIVQIDIQNVSKLIGYNKGFALIRANELILNRKIFN